MTHQATLLLDGRLYLHHGPIDLLIQAWGPPQAIRTAYAAATTLFPTILPTLCQERPALSRPLPTPPPLGPIARTMHAACTAMTPGLANEPVMVVLDTTIHTVPPGQAPPSNAPPSKPPLTPMAAVAGAVADHVLHAMTTAAPLDKALVNNGGDIAFHLTPGHTLRCALIPDLAAPTPSGTLLLHPQSPSRGLATSGRACKGSGGRSFSLGIADAVTILAPTAALADAAATIVANAVDLPGHPAITRRPASDIDPDSDLLHTQVTWSLAPLTPSEIAQALRAGQRTAQFLQGSGLIQAAILTLRGHTLTTLPDAIAA